MTYKKTCVVDTTVKNKERIHDDFFKTVDDVKRCDLGTQEIHFRNPRLKEIPKLGRYHDLETVEFSCDADWNAGVKVENLNGFDLGKARNLTLRGENLKIGNVENLVNLLKITIDDVNLNENKNLLQALKTLPENRVVQFIGWDDYNSVYCKNGEKFEEGSVKDFKECIM